MTAPPNDAHRSPPTEPARRSRWQRFSPSMGWQAFWSEILIVVLGVAIALAASEAVEAWNWRNKVTEAETRLEGDITWVFLWSAEKSVSQPCVDAQLAAMNRKVLESGDTLVPMPVITTMDREQVVRMPTRPYRFPVWEALLGDGTASHFPAQRQAILGRVSEDMAQARAYEAETRALGGALLVMRDPIALDPVVLRSNRGRRACGAIRDPERCLVDHQSCCERSLRLTRKPSCAAPRGRRHALPDQPHVDSMSACAQHEGAAMAVMIQIRNVPAQVHRVLKARSALLGKSLSDVILEELQAMAALPAPEELLLELREAAPFKMKRSSAALIRKERDAA
jgi:plasmid stability protein